MSGDTVEAQWRQHRLIPVAVLDRVDDAVPLADALVAGGLPLMEVTFRTDAAEGAIRAVSDRSDLCVGAGTVRNVEQVDRAHDAGARFLVSPGVQPAVIERAHALNLPILPGTATPTDVALAESCGVRVVKFFPAEACGGIPMLKAMAGPFHDIQFVPTGGIGAKNVADYLDLPCVVACGGSWMVARDWVRAGAFDRVIQATREAAEAVRI